MKKIVIMGLSLSLLIFINISVYAEQYSSMPKYSVDELIKIMKVGIDLNEDFKRSTNHVTMNEYREKKNKLETYYEKVLQQKLKDVIVILSAKNEGLLASVFFDLLISYENSADEMLSLYAGELFYRNPGLTEQAVSKYSKDSRKIINARLEDGWLYILKHYKITGKKKQDYQNRLKKIVSSANGDN